MAAWTSRAFALSAVFLLFLLSDAKDFNVGDTINGWQIPGGNETDLNDWAEANRFQIGDYLVWPFQVNDNNSAVEVNQTAYDSCDPTTPKATYEGVNDRTLLYRSGDFFFISGKKLLCIKGQRLQVRVLARRDQNPVGGNPSPGKSSGLPPPAGQTGTVPSAGPATPTPPPPPPSTTTEPAENLQSSSGPALTGTVAHAGLLLFTLGMSVVKLF